MLVLQSVLAPALGTVGSVSTALTKLPKILGE